jgi:hypothetical protein
LRAFPKRENAPLPLIQGRGVCIEVKMNSNSNLRCLFLLKILTKKQKPAKFFLKVLVFKLKMLRNLQFLVKICQNLGFFGEKWPILVKN